MKHTPGPWMVLDGKIVEKCYNGFVIADVRGATEVTRDEADARLMAAAPEMLEALKIAVVRLKEIQYQISSVKQVEFLESVIAKAEGAK